ncbi:MAG: fumarylacetoacetate hydrolase family protein [Candidatus Hermodarchaeia archaeon]
MDFIRLLEVTFLLERILQVKLVTYATDAGPRVGCIDDGEVVPTPGIPDIISLFNDNSLENSIEAALKGRIDAQPISEMTLLAPIPRPTKIIAIGLNYRDHAEETGQKLPDAPILFSKPPTATIGHGANIIIPNDASQIDYEVELGVVIGKGGRNIPVDMALEYVGGYTVFNDVSARDYQFRDGQWFRGKSFDTFAPMGPCLTLPDQIQDPQDLKMQLRLNGKTRQNSSTTNMVFSVAELIADISQVMTLEPGDVIATGTPSGVGFKVKPKPVFLQPGDVVEAEIDGIGVLRNPVEKDGELS